MLFITYNDNPSGIYSSQVIDVCRFFSSRLKTDIRLIAFISFRNFFFNRRIILRELPASVVIPMFPTIRLWRWNIISLLTLMLFIRHRQVIARGPFACFLALYIKKLGFIHEVIFDARGAYLAELNEYDVVDSSFIKKSIHRIEECCVCNSDFRMAVSGQLVQYWREKYNYQSEKHVVIPCTLHSDFTERFPSQEEIKNIRFSNGFSESDIVFVFSGSSAEWQSANIVDEFLYRMLAADIRYKAVLLAKNDFKLHALKKFPERIKQQWHFPDQVKKLLLACDYGILIRENTITNKVASPVKFAEYLSCGLKVIISENLGDYSSFVRQYKCGFVLANQVEIASPMAVSYDEKKNNYELAVRFLSKDAFLNSYRKILSCA